MRPKDCAYIVEHLSVRFMAMVADHSRQLAEHRAAFGARTEADAKIIAGLRSEIVAARMAVLERDSLMSERDGLLTQVQDMRAEMQRLSAQLDWERAEIKRLQWENLTMHKDAEDGYAAAIKVLGDPIALSKERDALRAEVAALQERLRASITRGDFAQMEVAALKSQTPKHPVVGEWVRRTDEGYPDAPTGYLAQVLSVSYRVRDQSGGVVVWNSSFCEPCDPPNHDTEAGKAAAESAVRTEPVADEIKVWDVVEVYQATGKHTAQNDVGFIGTVGTIHLADRVAHVRSGLGMPHMVDLCDVRKVRKVTT